MRRLFRNFDAVLFCEGYLAEILQNRIVKGTRSLFRQPFTLTHPKARLLLG